MDKEFIKAEKKEINEEEGTLVGIASKAIIDRDNELILNDAWKLDNFRKNPVLMLAHQYNELPVGKCLWIKSSQDGLRFKAKFANTARGKEVYELYKSGIMNCFSVGFKANPGGFVDNPTDVRYKGVKRLYKDVELLEISCVPIPANNQSLCEYVKSGKIQTKALRDELIEILDIKDIGEEIIEIKDGISSDNWIEVPIEEASSHKACKKKSIVISKKEGIEGLFCDDDQKIVSYMFDPEKWDETKAKKYIEDNHGKSFSIMEGKLIDIESKSHFDDSGDLVVVKIEKTENYIHVPVSDEEGMHKEHKIRTIEISKDEGIQGKYCVDDKKMVSFMFNLEKKYAWDEDKAKKWVKDYSEKKSLEIVVEGDEITVKMIEDIEVKAIVPKEDESEEVFMTRCMKEMGQDMNEEMRENSCKLIWSKKSVDESRVETKTIFPESENQPSSQMIAASIEKETNKGNNGDMTETVPGQMWWVSVLYPVDYPDGYAILSRYIGSNYTYEKVNYSFDVKTNIVTVINRVPVEQAWQSPDEAKAVRFEMPEYLKNISAKAEDVKIPSEDLNEIIKSFQSQIMELKCQMEGMKVPVAEVTAAIEVKAADQEGNPSLYDITCAINMALNDPRNMMMMNPEMEYGGYFSVIDIYATEFPGGHVVYSEMCKGGCKYYQIDYAYDMVDRKVSFVGEPKSVLQSWVEDRYGEQEEIQKNVEDVIVKEGRVLSNQNRQMLMDCISQMQEAIDAMQGLMDATEKKEEPKRVMTVADLFKEDEPAVIKNAEVDTIDLEDEEIKTKGEDEIEIKEPDSIKIDDNVELDEEIVHAAVEGAMKKSFKIDIGDVVKETIAKRLGRVIL